MAFLKPHLIVLWPFYYEVKPASQTHIISLQFVSPHKFYFIFSFKGLNGDTRIFKRKYIAINYIIALITSIHTIYNKCTDNVRKDLIRRKNEPMKFFHVFSIMHTIHMYITSGSGLHRIQPTNQPSLFACNLI